MKSRRRLPHVYPHDAWLFVTWHLHGSLPERFPAPEKLSAGEAFVWIDRYLDTTRSGPMFLLRHDVAEIVEGALRLGVEQRRFELAAFAIMSNHVHVVIRARRDPAAVLKWLKGSTAREANLLLKRTGLPFWQRESYDRWVRDDEELRRIIAYVEKNPVKAGLVGEAGLYRWSSAHERALKCLPAR